MVACEKVVDVWQWAEKTLSLGLKRAYQISLIGILIVTKRGESLFGFEIDDMWTFWSTFLRGFFKDKLVRYRRLYMGHVLF